MPSVPPPSTSCANVLVLVHQLSICANILKDTHGYYPRIYPLRTVHATRVTYIICPICLLSNSYSNPVPWSGWWFPLYNKFYTAASKLCYFRFCAYMGTPSPRDWIRKKSVFLFLRAAVYNPPSRANGLLCTTVRPPKLVALVRILLTLSWPKVTFPTIDFSNHFWYIENHDTYFIQLNYTLKRTVHQFSAPNPRFKCFFSANAQF
jgi:hypothetical protein